MKTQIILERSQEFAAVASLMAETADAGYVRVATTELYSPDFERIMRGWQALAGLLLPLPPVAGPETLALLQRYHVADTKTVQTVLWISGG